MARIVLGIGSSHAPQLALPPDQWWRRADFDRQNPELWFHGKTYDFVGLVKERASEHLEDQLSPSIFEERFTACQTAIGAIAETLRQVNPDVAVIIGDDQHECFSDDNMPALAVYWGDSVDSAPPEPGGHNGEYASATPGLSRYPEVRTANPCQSDLALQMIGSLIKDEYDVTHCRTLPKGRHGQQAIGHAFTYVYRRLMHDEVIPHVPVLLNTYFPPNQPSLKRCYELGRSIRRAIESWDSDKTVAIIASGGLSHFVIEEAIDYDIIEALKTKDPKGLTTPPVEWFNSGTSEIRNWIVTAGALEASDLQMELVDYVPCYRSEAGTGCAMAFAQWM